MKKFCTAVLLFISILTSLATGDDIATTPWVPYRVTILSPNGGEYYTTNDHIPFSFWTPFPIGSYYEVDLIRPGIFPDIFDRGIYTGHTLSAGQNDVSIAIPNFVPLGDYLIRLVAYNGDGNSPWVEVHSHDYFAIVSSIPTNQPRITVISPNGGEELPQNTYMAFWWSNSVPLRVAEYLDRYNDSGVLVETIPLIAKGYYRSGFDYTSWYHIDQGNLPLGKYKVRVVGVTESGEAYTDESDNFFFVTPAAKIACWILGENSFWLSNETKTIQLDWTNLSVGDPYDVYLFSDQFVGEAYGFRLQSGIVESKNGTLTFDAPFPTVAMSTYPEIPNQPIDGPHRVVFINRKNYLRSESASIDLILNEVHLKVLPQPAFTAEIKKEVRVLTIEVDARFAHSDVRALTIPFLMDMNPPTMGTKIRYALYDGKKRISDEETLTMPAPDKYVSVSLKTDGDFKVKQGHSKIITLRTEVLSPTEGLMEWALDGYSDKLHAEGKKDKVLSAVARFDWGPVITIVPAKNKH